MNITLVFFFVLFASMGLYIALRGQRNSELWLVTPPVFLSIALGVSHTMSVDPLISAFLWGLLWVFATSAGGAIIGLGCGRMLAARRAAS